MGTLGALIAQTPILTISVGYSCEDPVVVYGSTSVQPTIPTRSLNIRWVYCAMPGGGEMIGGTINISVDGYYMVKDFAPVSIDSNAMIDVTNDVFTPEEP